MKAAGISDRGKVREKNEDSYLLYNEKPFNLFAVADGMGGHAAGEVASKLALETIRSYLQRHGKTLLLDKPGESVPGFISGMLSFTNKKVLEASLSDNTRTGMGTTLTMVFGILDHFWLGHIGDTRAYLINKENISSLTEDHTLVGQLMRSGQLSEKETNDHPQRHILTRALGTEVDESFDISPLYSKPGDLLLLCSDGLYSLVENEEIYKTVREQKDLQEALSHLVQIANQRGGTDNITAVLICL